MFGLVVVKYTMLGICFVCENFAVEDGDPLWFGGWCQGEDDSSHCMPYVGRPLLMC